MNSIMGIKGLDYETLNENVKKVQYAVRGELYLRASELQKEGKKVYFAFFLLIEHVVWLLMHLLELLVGAEVFI